MSAGGEPKKLRSVPANSAPPRIDPIATARKVKAEAAAEIAAPARLSWWRRAWRWLVSRVRSS